MSHFDVNFQTGVQILKLGPGDDEIRLVLIRSMWLVHAIVDCLNTAFGLDADAIVARIAVEVDAIDIAAQ
jgi:hypothetical protein